MMPTLCAHVIPIGGGEPAHVCHISCWCYPLETDPGVIAHNALDHREAYERQTGQKAGPGKQWVRVMENVE